MFSVYFAMLKSAVSYLVCGRQLPAWDLRLQMYSSGIRQYTRMLFPLTSDDYIDTIDFGKIHDTLQANQMPPSKVPPEIGLHLELQITVADISIDRDSIRGIGVTEKPLLSLIDSEQRDFQSSGKSRTIAYDLITPWSACEQVGIGLNTTTKAALEPSPLNPNERVILYLHGGSYVLGNPVAYREPVGYLAHYTLLRTFVIDYRLAPRHPFPAQLHDALIAFNFLIRQGFTPQNIILAGDSAGGHLCLDLMLLLRHGGSSLHRFAGLMLISPLPSLILSGDSLNSNGGYDYLVSLPMESPNMPLRLFYRPGAKYTSEYKQELKDSMLTPVNGSLADFPPTIIQCGAAELLLDDIRELYTKIKSDNPGTQIVFEEYPDMVHVFHRFLFRPESKQAYEALQEFAQTI
ncbi:hypothetical protein IW152_002955 [Coemansia sp. BCRC 34962]|nr:hypothetical protein IW152_002955 [Coemansia sp. BCRC 34962]